MNLFLPLSLDHIEIYVIVDNYIDDSLLWSPGVKRYTIGKDGKLPINSYLAEHALSLLITAVVGSKKYQLVLDAACTKEVLPHNIKFAEMDLSKVEDIVISHGHEDHMGALPELLKLTGKNTKVYAHPAAFHTPRYYRTDAGELLLEPAFEKKWITSAHGQLVETPDPRLICKNTILITGEIPRKTKFEKALPGSLLESNGKLIPDSIADDQAIISVIKDKGLVIISGCAHAGIINTVNYAQKLTGVESVYAVIGGFHLGGDSFQQAVQPTIDALKDINPQFIVPMHCTGIEAKEKIRQQFPGQSAVSGVGSTFQFPIN
jgi:7,8-dihydropterin-6-yl-methyl-4-(beta-D-ribofuranosyl)aminobenzene 5'-phosphate synthase